MSTIHAAIEIGTTRTVLAVGESEPDGRPRLVSHAEIPSSGVRKSQILDLTQATESVRAVLKKLEREQSGSGAPLSVGNAFLAVTGSHVMSDPHQGMVQVGGARVTTDDIRAVDENSKLLTLAKDRELLDIVEQSFELDDVKGIREPRGMAGRVLKLNTLHLHADRNRIQDARTAADAAHLEIREPLFALTCAADAVLEETERKNGVLLLDLGGGSTGYAVYCDGALVASEVLGIGGDHVTSDIAYAFQTTNAQAEKLKIHDASALIRPDDAAPARVHIEGSSTLMESRTISRRSLDTVVNARWKELLLIIREKLEDADLLTRLHTGVVLTGGGAAMRDLDALIQHEFGHPVRTGRPIGIDGFDALPDAHAYAVLAGALLYAHRNYEDKPLLKNIFGGLFK